MLQHVHIKYRLQLLYYNWYRYMLGWPQDWKFEVSMLPEHKYMSNETYLASSVFPPASFKTFSPVATSRSTEKKPKQFLNNIYYM